MARVFIGVGHGGADPGAVANSFKEKELNLTIALACRDELERCGVQTMMSRTVDEDETLSGKIKMSNEFAPDLTMDIHNNAGGGDGAEVFYSRSGSGKPLAENILAEFQAIGQNSRGAKTKLNPSGEDGFLFIRNTHAPAVLVECAFIDNTRDLEIIDTAAEQKKFGMAIAKGVLKTLGITWKPETEPGEDTASRVLYRVQVGAYAVRENAERMLERLKAAGFADAYIRT